ncbi:Fic family protein [Candidatus Woesearchaeota archaeon]|nr:Fic family protein [Candidatus Woesearchaeota archaeon]
MKYIKKKLIKNREYYYFEYPLKEAGETFTRYLGAEVPLNIKELLQEYFEEIARRTVAYVRAVDKIYFPPGGIETVEKSRFRHRLLTHELFSREFSLFKSLFYILFMLNSNRAEGSKVTRPDIEEIMERRVKPKTIIEKETINSIEAINFALSKEMRWNEKSIKKIHQLLFWNIHPEISGKYKQVEVVVNNSATTPSKEVKREIKRLLVWLKKNRKIYPPRLALELHWRFEAIHPFEDGNGRVGRILLNSLLIEQGYAPVIFFSENHSSYCNAIAKAVNGNKKPISKHFIESVKKTEKAIEKYRSEGILTGGSAQVGKWEIQRGKIRRGF